MEDNQIFPLVSIVSTSQNIINSDRNDGVCGNIEEENSQRQYYTNEQQMRKDVDDSSQKNMDREKPTSTQRTTTRGSIGRGILSRKGPVKVNLNYSNKNEIIERCNLNSKLYWRL